MLHLTFLFTKKKRKINKLFNFYIFALYLWHNLTCLFNTTKRLKMKLNKTKSVRINKTIPYVVERKYLGITLDTRLHWKAHVKKEKEELLRSGNVLAVGMCQQHYYYYYVFRIKY